MVISHYCSCCTVLTVQCVLWRCCAQPLLRYNFASYLSHWELEQTQLVRTAALHTAHSTNYLRDPMINVGTSLGSPGSTREHHEASNAQKLKRRLQEPDSSYQNHQNVQENDGKHFLHSLTGLVKRSKSSRKEGAKCNIFCCKQTIALAVWRFSTMFLHVLKSPWTHLEGGATWCNFAKI